MPAPRAITSGRMFSLETILSRRAFSTLSSLPRSGRIAWKRRSRPCLAEPPAESPSTMIQLALGRVSLLAVGQLARQRHALQGALADDQVAGLAGGLARTRGDERLLDDATAVGRVLVEVLADALGHGRLDLALDLGIAELGLGLAFELRIDELDADDGGQTLADVVAGEVGVRVLEDARLCGRSRSRSGSGRRGSPVMWEPPSTVLMLLAKLKTFSAYESLYWRATSIGGRSPRGARRRWAGRCSDSLFLLRWRTKETSPPSK